jgi:hypothetical protein
MALFSDCLPILQALTGASAEYALSMNEAGVIQFQGLLLLVVASGT